MSNDTGRSEHVRRIIAVTVTAIIVVAAGVAAGMALGSRLAGGSGEKQMQAREMFERQLAAVRELERLDQPDGCTVTLEVLPHALPMSVIAPGEDDASDESVQIIVSAFSQSVIDSLAIGGALQAVEVRAVASRRTAESLRSTAVHTTTMPGITCGDIARFGALVTDEPSAIVPDDPGPPLLPPPIIT
jgi:hypothetical protein